MLKDIIIVGAGSFGREVLETLRQINRIEPTWTIKGFINDIPTALDGFACKEDYPIIGTIRDWQPKENETFAMGVASPDGKEKLATMLKSRGAVFATIISPMTFVSDYATIGEGCVITGLSVGDHAHIGNFVTIAGSMVGGECEIGDYTTSTGFSNLTDAKIGKKVYVGSHAVILNHRKIGDEAFICAGSIVFNHVKAGTKVWGNPAKRTPF